MAAAEGVKGTGAGGAAKVDRSHWALWAGIRRLGFILEIMGARGDNKFWVGLEQVFVELNHRVSLRSGPGSQDRLGLQHGILGLVLAHPPVHPPVPLLSPEPWAPACSLVQHLLLCGTFAPAVPSSGDSWLLLCFWP